MHSQRNMNKLIIVLALVAVAAAAPQQQQPKYEEPIPILRLENEGTGNGIRAEESGYVKQLEGRSEEESQANQVQGSYSYTGPDGVVYTITYIADENGFRAEGAHLPTPPPMPEAIQRALDFIASQPKQPQQAPSFYLLNMVSEVGCECYSYKTANGIQAEESGYVRQLQGRSKEDSEAQVMQGSYSYTGPDGVLYTVNYIADENGFRAQGVHLPNTLPAYSPPKYDEGAHRPIPPPPPTLRPPTTTPPPPGLPPVRLVFALVLVAVGLAQRQQKKDEPIPILHYDNEGVDHDGSYKYSFKTGNGIQAEQSGFVRQLEGRKEEESKAQVMEGSYSYTGPDGVLYTVNYIADENGFRAEGAHLPKQPHEVDQTTDEPVSLPLVRVGAKPQGKQEPIAILRFDNEGVNHDESYKFSYETGNGIRAEESGYIKELPGRSAEESKAQVMEGSYSYTGPNGQVYTVNYIADENGFRIKKP
ncbi:hypothetical protein B566_EDAN014188 [Ephemera danica]|nr:hypothetical protein B566_EDAN014188 [Ephemera danica]